MRWSLVFAVQALACITIYFFALGSTCPHWVAVCAAVLAATSGLLAILLATMKINK